MRTTWGAGCGVVLRWATVFAAAAGSIAVAAAFVLASVRAAMVAINASVADVLTPAMVMRDAAAG